MDTSSLIKDPDVTFSILLLLDIRTLSKLRRVYSVISSYRLECKFDQSEQVSRSLQIIIDNSRYLWTAALQHLWRENHTPYPYPVPIRDLSLDEIIRTAQRPYKLGYGLGHHPERINTSSTWLTTDCEAGSIRLLDGGRWMLYITSSGLNLAIADLCSIEDGKPKVYQELQSSEGPLGSIFMRSVQWHSDPNCAIVLISYRNSTIPAVIMVEWSHTSPYIPSFHRRIIFDSALIDFDACTTQLAGDYCIFNRSVHQPTVMWNWRTNKTIALSLEAHIYDVLSPTELLVYQHDYQGYITTSVSSVVETSHLEANNYPEDHHLPKSNCLVLPPEIGFPYNLRDQDHLSKTRRIMHQRPMIGEGYSSYVMYGVTTISPSPAGSPTASASWTARSYRFRADPSSILWKSGHIIIGHFSLFASPNGNITFSLFDLDKPPSTTNPTVSGLDFGHPANVPGVGRLNPSSFRPIGFCGVSGTLLLRVDRDAYMVVKLSPDV